ncbi:MAG: molybdopterin-dependent oxidoreductase [Desulfurobacteriaceae bacterium]
MLKRTVCTYCGVGCEIAFENGKPRPLKEGVVSKGKLCIKGNFGHEFIESPKRLKGAYVRKSFLKEFGFDPNNFETFDENFVKVPYSLAYDLVAKKFLDIKEKFGGNSFAAIGGARTNCESVFAFQKFAREVMGSLNIDNCARICHAPSLRGLVETVGEGAASIPFDEIYNAELIVVIGSNTTEAHPIVSHRIIEKVRKGGKLAVIDVREIGLFKFAKHKLLIPFESNLLVLNAIARVILEEELYNKEFIEKRTKGFEEYKKAILNDDLSDPKIFRKLKGYENLEEKIRNLAKEIATSKTVFLWGLGVTEHIDGSKNVMAIANLALLTGNVGKEGTGLMPLRGQNNVQGACDIGMLPYYLPDYQKTEGRGLMTPEVIDAILDGKIKALFVMGEDLAHVHPNVNKIRRALSKLDFLVVNELFPCEITKFADVVFGVKSCYEKMGVYVNAERRLHLSEPIFEVDLPDDWGVISEIAKRMGVDFGYKTSEDVWNEVRKAAPKRFSGASYEVLRKNFLNSPQWPVVDGKGTRILHTDEFSTEDGKGRFKFNRYAVRGMVKELLESGDFKDFYLTTGRILVHYNNAVQTGNCPTLEKFKTFKEDVVYASEEDRERLKNAKRVKLVSPFGETKDLPIEFNKHIKRGTLFVSFHRAKSMVNALFGDEGDQFVKTAKFKSVKVKVEVVE